MKKNILSGIFFMTTLVACIGFSINVHAAEVEDPSQEVMPLSLTTEEINHLKSLGFQEHEIENMTQEEYDLNKNLKGEVVSEDEKFVKVVKVPSKNQPFTALDSNDDEEYISIELDEATYNKEVAELKNKEKINTYGYIPDGSSTSYKRMVTTIVKLSTNEFRVKNAVNWSTMPFWRYIDISAVGINSAHYYPQVNSQYGAQSWVTKNAFGTQKSHSATYTSNSDKWNKKEGGYGLRMNLPNNDQEYSANVTTLSSYMYYTAYKENKATKHIDAFGHYAHQETSASLVPSYSLSGSSFTINVTAKFTIHEPGTHAVYSW